MIKQLYWYLFIRDLNDSLDKPSTEKGMPLKKKLVQDLAFVLLLSYGYYIFSPLMPLVSDLIAHTFWEKEHLQTAHHQYGNNHTSIEIGTAEKRANKADATNNQKGGQEIIAHTLVVNIRISIPPAKILKQEYSLFNCVPPFHCKDIDYPPPRS